MGRVGAKLLFMFCTVKARTCMLGTRFKLYKTPELVPTALRDTRFRVKKTPTTHLRPSESTNDRVERSSSEPSSASFGRSGLTSLKDGLPSPTTNVVDKPHCFNKWLQADASASVLIAGPVSLPVPASGKLGGGPKQDASSVEGSARDLSSMTVVAAVPSYVRRRRRGVNVCGTWDAASGASFLVY